MTDASATPHRVPEPALGPRLIATDLDGTLLHDDKTVSDRTIAALAAAERAGVEVFFVTGRPARWMGVVSDHVHGHGLAICANGAAVVDLHRDRRIVEVSPLERAVARAVVDALRRAAPGTTFAVERTGGIHYEPQYPPFHLDPAAVIAPVEKLLADDFAPPPGPAPTRLNGSDLPDGTDPAAPDGLARPDGTENGASTGRLRNAATYGTTPSGLLAATRTGAPDSSGTPGTGTTHLTPRTSGTGIPTTGPDQPILKLLAHHPDLDPDAFLALARATAGGLASFTRSSPTALLEISGPGVSKAGTLARCCAERGITPEEVVAFGDMPNDIEMLGWAGTSYAMANAHPDVLATTTGRTVSNNEDGVAAVIEQILKP
ncbi:HAD hydrolase family protein [Streptomyces pinistramenti]|uniref:HAD hydrolase family protein n=1 Tax=Streptomyces pinistramenti TaxID=2884812 RepID=UPI001D08F604|nr:HAD hydrolase family protein [Streptomyces pinistramenti]MCB5912074.1 HAD hydrolase family protein [Streptomyces pinistramenti]